MVSQTPLLWTYNFLLIPARSPNVYLKTTNIALKNHNGRRDGLSFQYLLQYTEHTQDQNQDANVYVILSHVCLTDPSREARQTLSVLV
jgi:hypothetical protein